MQNVRLRNRHGTMPDDVAEVLRKKSANVGRRFDSVQDIDVLLDVPHKSHRKGNETVVKITARIPRQEPIIVHGSDQEVVDQGQNIFFAIDQAFEALDQKLQRNKHRPSHQRLSDQGVLDEV
jgi:ribosomal subunit interface protein